MQHKHEIRGNLARLLATENLNIENANVDTASFNVETRTLTLPIWEKASDLVYELLLSHECAHAIYTPNVDWTELTSVPMDFLNIIEDARIEKLMKRKFPGLKKTFFGGYKQLNDDDFFGISGVNLNKYNLADRINLYFKIGHFVELNFTEEEKELLSEIEDAETFEDAIRCAEKLYEFCKQSEMQKNVDSISWEVGSGQGNSGESMQVSPGDGNGQLDSQSGATNGEQSQNGEDGSGATNGEQLQNGEAQNSSAGDYNPAGKSGYVKTCSTLQKAINKLSANVGNQINYLHIPKIDLNKVIVTPKQIHTKCNRYWGSNNHYDFTSVDLDYKKFKSSAKKEVNYLVKEFECKKAADSYSRASESKTGILDCNTLHTYKFNEDIFKKVVTLADGKNHGLIFILDWSGSMDRTILDTCKQLFNLIWFCKKVSIPFEVYAFTNSWSCSYRNTALELNSMIIDESFNLLNMISSKVNAQTLENHMRNVYRLAYAHTCNYCTYSFPNELNLSGTPLNESLVSLHYIIPEFSRKTKVQKVQCVVLTDGEASALPMSTHAGMRGIGDDCYLKDKKLKTTYRFPRYSYYASHEFTDVLLRHLKDVFPFVNFIGIRLLTTGEISGFIRKHLENNNELNSHDKIMDEWKRHRSCAIRCAGYDSYFGIYSGALNASTEFTVKEDSSTTSIRNAFKKSLEYKKMNKKILSQFIDLIA